MYTAIYIQPNNNDDWTTAEGSPFNGYTLEADQLGFVLGTSNVSVSTDYVLVPTKLVDIEEIQRDVDIFRKSSSRILEGKQQITGVGGIAKSGDFVFVLENVTDTIDQFKLLGRSVIATINLDSNSIDNISSDDIVFKGKVFNMEPDKKGLAFTVRSQLQMLKDSIIGDSLSNAENNYANIDPVVYGDLTDADAFAPLKYAGEDIREGLSVGNRAIQEITNLVVYDKESDSSLGSAVPLIEDSGVVRIAKNEPDLYTKSDVDIQAEDTEIWIYDPELISFKLDSNPDDLTPKYEGGSSVYKDSLDQRYVFFGIREGYYLFTTPDPEHYSEPSKSGTLTYVEGSGPSTLDYSWFSSRLPSKIDITDENYPNSADSYIDAKSDPIVLSINDEKVFVKYVIKHQYEDTDGYCYQHTAISVIRGYDGTTATSHGSIGHNSHNTIPVYFDKEETNPVHWIFKHRLFPNRLNRIGAVGHDGAEDTEPIDDDLIDFRNDAFTIDNVASLFPKSDGSLHDDPCVVTFNQPHTYDKFYILLVELNFSSPFQSSFNLEDVFVQGTYEVGSSLSSLDYSLRGSIGWWAGGLPLALDDLEIPHAWGTSIKIYSSGFLGCFVKQLHSSQEFLVVGEKPGTALAGIVFNNTGWDDSLYFNNVIGFKTADEKTFNLKIKDLSLLEDERYHTLPIKSTGDFEDLRLCLAFKAENPSSDLSATINYYVNNPSLLLYFRVDPTKVKFWWRGKGRYVSNTLIENPSLVLGDILHNELNIDSSDIDSISFNEVEDARINWRIAFSLSEEPIRFGDLAQKICEQSGTLLAEDSQGRVTLSDLRPPSSTDGLRSIDTILFDEGANIADWEEEFSAIDKIFTDLTTYYRHNVISNKFAQALSKDDVSGLTTLLNRAKNIIDKEKKAVLRLDYVRDAETASYVANLAGVYNSIPIRFLTFTCPLEYKDFRQGEWVVINSPYITKALGKIYCIIESTIQPGYLDVDPYVKIKVFEVPDYLSDDIIQEVPESDSLAWSETDTSDDDDQISETSSLD